MPQVSFVYGPVPSRRLGLSLGLSIVPRKTCSLDCIYCQCGKTTCKTLKRRSFFPVDEILEQVRAALKKTKPDFVTFSGEGEPTLNSDLGRLIRQLKKVQKGRRNRRNLRTAVITNSTLITDPQVRRDLCAADLVVPSLDAADEEVFKRVNRPHQGIRASEIIKGLVKFRRYYRGQIWLEILLVKDVNDSPEHLVKLRRAAEEIRPDRIHLNTVVRPPGAGLGEGSIRPALPCHSEGVERPRNLFENAARRLSPDDLEQIQMLFGPDSEIADSALPKKRGRFSGDADSAVTNIVRNRPVTSRDLERSLGLGPAEVERVLRRLVRAGLIRRVNLWGKVFYEPGSSSGF